MGGRDDRYGWRFSRLVEAAQYTTPEHAYALRLCGVYCHELVAFFTIAKEAWGLKMPVTGHVQAAYEVRHAFFYFG